MMSFAQVMHRLCTGYAHLPRLPFSQLFHTKSTCVQAPKGVLCTQILCIFSRANGHLGVSRSEGDGEQSLVTWGMPVAQAIGSISIFSGINRIICGQRPCGLLPFFVSFVDCCLHCAG